MYYRSFSSHEPRFSCWLLIIRSFESNRVMYNRIFASFLQLDLVSLGTLVELIGIVVAKDLKSNRGIFTVDDATGLLVCETWFADFGRDTLPPLLVDEVGVGSLVTARGTLASYDGLLKLKLDRLSIVDDPNAEALHLLDIVSLHRHANAACGS
eukprot:TRINITY_DN23892_c0_g1_i1.p1 TRINITY_DN23892_c0_g1~~TRINITY_DN23892_c0_g1_i1.p1  ORF type:complete len:154 (-),score=26.75 TRINITY_DN23892_c0_g1_i1:103-564(-)